MFLNVQQIDKYIQVFNNKIKEEEKNWVIHGWLNVTTINICKCSENE